MCELSASSLAININERGDDNNGEEEMTTR